MKLAAAFFWTSCLMASSPGFWEMSSYQEFIKGKFESVSLGRDGVLSVAPKLDPVFASGQAYIWSIAQGGDGSIYAGTGNAGRLYRIDSRGNSTVLWSAPQPEIFAVAAGPGAVVYAGTSPNGKVYRIEGGKAAEYFDPKSTYIWALALAADGSLFVGTGGEGKIFHVTAAGQGEEYYATGQANVTGLGFDREGRLLAGSEPNGILYRISAKDKAFVLYDSNLPEIRAMAVAADGSVYAAGLGGSVAKKASSASQSGAGAVTGVPTVTTSITVTADAAAQAGGEIKPPAEPAKPQPAAQPAVPAVTPVATAAEVTGVEKSAIYKIHADNTVETLFSSKEENVYDVLAQGDRLLFCTDVSGRIYSLSADRKLTLVTQTNDAEVTRLFRRGTSALAATGTGGRIYRLDDAPAALGSYESPVYDAGSVARWGHVRWQGSAGASIRTRSGNSLRPDRTWSDWSAPLTVAVGAQVASLNARFIQWKAELRTGATVESVTLAYLPQNNPPLVRSITALSTLQAAAQAARTTNASANAAYTLTVTDTGDAAPASSTGTPTQTLSRAASQQIVLSWQADDPDGDKLVYALYFHGEGEREWKLLRDNLHENTFTLDGDALADGRYLFRVVASDREVNAGASALEHELVSSPVLIDNSPPIVTITASTASGVDVEAADATSSLRRCEYAIDGGVWIPLAPVEGILDSRAARFHIDLSKRPAGEHLLVVRAFDSGNNAGLAKVVLH